MLHDRRLYLQSVQEALEQPFSTRDAAISYLHLLNEMIGRITFVGSLLSGTNIPPALVRELAYLQFRKVCEMLALGSLYLHGDLPGAKSLTGEWNAEQIMKKLRRLHPDFFQKSAAIVQDGEREGGQKVWRIVDNFNAVALTLGDLKTLYAECGVALHRGKIKTLNFDAAVRQEDWDAIAAWQERLVGLINSHVVYRAGNSGAYIFNAKGSNDLPHCSILAFSGDGGVTVEHIGTNVAT